MKLQMFSIEKKMPAVRGVVLALTAVVLAFSVVSGGGFCKVQAQQDNPLSANFELPTMINPAKGGLLGEDFNDYKTVHHAALNYKTQMSAGFTAAAIRVLSASYNMLLFDRKLSAGVNIFSNTLNNAALSDFSMHLNCAYHWVLSKEAGDHPAHRLSFGLQAGFRRWGIDVDKIQTGAQYDPSYAYGYNPAIHPGFDFEETARTVLDLQAGVHYTGWVMPNIRAHGGISGYHLNRGQFGLTSLETRTPIRFAFYGGAMWQNKPAPTPSEKPNYSFAIDRSAMTSEVTGTLTFVNQGPYCTFEIAALYRMYLSGDFVAGAGMAYRTLSKANVFSPILSVSFSNIMVNLQCDLNLGAGAAYTNIFAIGLGYRM